MNLPPRPKAEALNPHLKHFTYNYIALVFLGELHINTVDHTTLLGIYIDENQQKWIEYKDGSDPYDIFESRLAWSHPILLCNCWLTLKYSILLENQPLMRKLQWPLTVYYNGVLRGFIFY